MSGKNNIGVILSGCGHKDGSEIHEAVMVLWAIQTNGADYHCFAPDIDQAEVINHLTGEAMAEKRNVLTEAARIARGRIKEIKQFDPDRMDAVIIPGGLGAAKNLSTFSSEGPDCRINEETANVIKAMADRKKPIGALCIAPVLLPEFLNNVMLTLGKDEQATEALERMGAQAKPTDIGELVIDQRFKVVSTPCYMMEATIDQIADSADKLVKAVMNMISP